MEEFHSLDAVISGVAYEYATTALGVLERRKTTTASISTEMLCTLDNLIKVLLFSERVFVTGIADKKGFELVPREARFQGSEPAKRAFEGAGVFHQLPTFTGDQKRVYANVERTLGTLGSGDPRYVIECTFPKKKIAAQQEIVLYDVFFIEYAIEQCGAQRFKPVFPGDQLYLGLRSKRLPRPPATHSMADIAGIRLRELVAAEMSKLNRVARFGAPFLPPLPPIFITQLLRNGDGENLGVEIVRLRESATFKEFRKWVAKCMELAQSGDAAARQKVANAVAALETFSFEIHDSGSVIRDAVKLTLDLAKGDIVGLILDRAESVIRYLTKYPLDGLSQFSTAHVDTARLDAFVIRNFGDRFTRTDLNQVSMFLGLPENLHQWAFEDFEASIRQGQLDGSAPELSRPYSVSVEDPDMVGVAQAEFDRLWQAAKPVKPDSTDPGGSGS